MKKKLVIAIIMLALLLGVYEAPSPARAVGPLWAFVVVGQSNGVLMCNPESIAPGMEAYYAQANLPDSITAYYGTSALTICAAVGGSSIASWQPGQANYTAALAQVSAAQQSGYTVKAIILNQGESDASSTTSNWTTQAANFLDTFRAAIGNQYLPVVYTQLGKHPYEGTNPYLNWETIRKAQHALRYNRPAFFMVEKTPYDDYESGAPWAHNTPASLKAIKDQIMIYLRGWVPKP